MAKKSSSVDEYLELQKPEVKAALAKLRKAIRAAAPKAEEKISYNLPFYRQNGHLAAFVSQKNHLSFVTMSSNVINKFKAELKPFKVSGTTIQFQPDNPLPAVLVKKILKARLKENMERESKSKSKSKNENNIKTIIK
ncbi:MAG: DUF1801 domain-containing protein [Ignavibacteria bacterium]